MQSFTIYLSNRQHSKTVLMQTTQNSIFGFRVKAKAHIKKLKEDGITEEARRYVFFPLF